LDSIEKEKQDAPMDPLLQDFSSPGNNEEQFEVLVNRSLGLLERTFHLVLHYGDSSEAFADYKQCQDVLQLIEDKVDCRPELRDRIVCQMARFDWSALNSEIRSRAL
jgi:hypothetical protein